MSIYYKSIEKIKPYLYDIYYSELDYDFAYEYFKNQEDPINEGGCSSIRNGNFLGRNFDWLYDNEAEFIVHVPKIGNRYSSIGMAGGFTDLTDAFVQSGTESELYKVLPFHMYDGINSCGVCCSSNVTPLDKGKNKTIPTGTLNVELNAMMVIRYVLDNFSTAREAVNYIKEHISIYFSKSLHDMNHEAHFLICDTSDTFLVEFINNQTIIIDNTKKYMTNFYLSDIILNDNGTVYTPETQDEQHNAFDTNLITLQGCGLERYNIINEYYDKANTKKGIRNLLNKLTYTKAYINTENIWYTEFVSNIFSVKTDKAVYDAAMPLAREAYFNRNRNNPEIWQTVHSSVYDIEKRRLYLIVQEDSEELAFKLENDGGNEMFRIMEVKHPGMSELNSSYRFQTTVVNGEVVPVELETEEELDEYIEDLLNNKGYSKSDFIIVTKKEYDIDTDIVEE